MGVLFAGVAVWTGAKIAKSCLDGIRLRNADVVDASILNMERRVEAAGDGTREVVIVTYAYDYQGRRFEHRTRKLTLFGKSSQLHERLEHALKHKEPVPCYVSPSDPSLSVFSREFSVPLFLLSLLFPLAFGTVAVIALRTIVKNYRSDPTRTNTSKNQSDDSGQS